MSTRKVTSILFVASFIGWCVGYVLTNSIYFKLCTYGNLVRDPSCLNFYERIGDPLYYGMLALAIVFALLAIFPSAFYAWRRFAIWSLPLAVEVFIFYKGGTYDPYPEQVFRWMSAVYVIVSFAIVVTSIVRKSAKKSTRPQAFSRKKRLIFWSVWALFIAILFVPHLYDLMWYLTA